MKLHLADDLTLPLDAVTQAIGFLGRRGSGKSYAATKLAECMLEARAQIVAMDPVGTWYGLRLGKGFDIPVLGGLRGDIPLEATGGALVADLIVDRGISAVLDVSQMISTEQARFATDFAERFFQRKKAAPSAVHLFLEECQEFVPQNPQGGGLEPKMMHSFQRLVKLGRNFGIGVSLISQRPQEVNKKVLNQIELLLAFQMTGPQERKVIQGWTYDKGVDEDVFQLLPKLEVGSPRAWSPQWLEVSKTIRIAAKRSLDTSSTPKVGTRAAAAKPLTPIDIKELRGAMAATIERAKLEDPKELRRENVALKREVEAVKRELAATKKLKASRAPVFKKAHEKIMERHVKLLMKMISVEEKLSKQFEMTIMPTREKLRDAAMKMDSMLSEVLSETKTGPQPIQRQSGAYVTEAFPLGIENGAVTSKKAKPNGLTQVDDKLTRCARAILMALVQRYPRPSTDSQLAILSGYSIKSSGFANALSELRTADLMRGTRHAMLPTESGRARMGHVPPLPTGQDLINHWMGKLGKCERTLLDVVFNRQSVTREQLSEQSGYSLDSSGFANALSTLRTLELITGERGAQIQIHDSFKE